MSQTASAPPTPAEKVPFANPQLSLEILPYIKTAQNQNGLRRAEYGRYREYCARRLRRVRKGVKFVHGKVKYVPRAVEASEVKDGRFVEMMVMEAERAWAGAMASKEEEESGERGGRAKFHSLRRLRKAVQWAKKLVALCDQVSDNRTQLEAQAYMFWMSGNELFERERWQEVKAPLLQAKTYYEQLSQAVSPEQSELYTTRVEELTTLYRFALSKAPTGSGSDSAISTSSDSIRSLMTLASDDPALKVLQSKLGSVIEATQRQRAAQASDITWFGRTIVLKSPALKLAFVKAHETTSEVQNVSTEKSDKSGEISQTTTDSGAGAKSTKQKAESLGRKLAAYDKLFQVWSDTKLRIRDERAAALQMASNEALLKDLELAMHYAMYTEQNQMIVRNLLLVSSIEKKIDSAGFDNLASVKPDEVVRMYESTLQLLNETDQIRSTVVSSGQSNPTEVASAKDALNVSQGREYAYKAIRCYYLALSYTQVEKWSDAVALLARAKQFSETAPKLLSTSSGSGTASHDPKLSKRLSHLNLQIRSAQIWIHAKSALESAPESATLSAATSASSSPLQTSDSHPSSLLSDLKSWDASSYATTRIIDFPPTSQAVPSKPVLFDLAFSGFQAPDLSAKAKAPKSGFFSSFWRS